MPGSQAHDDAPAGDGAGLLGLSVKQAECLLIEQALTATGHKVSEAAQQLGARRGDATTATAA